MELLYRRREFAVEGELGDFRRLVVVRLDLGLSVRDDSRRKQRVVLSGRHGCVLHKPVFGCVNFRDLTGEIVTRVGVLPTQQDVRRSGEIVLRGPPFRIAFCKFKLLKTFDAEKRLLNSKSKLKI